MFENFVLKRNEDTDDDHPFIVACKDREEVSDERWVVSALNNQEVKHIYEMLSDYFKEEEAH